MGKDYQLRRTIFFVFYFFLKVGPSGRLILIKNLLLEQIFGPVEMSFTNDLVLCATTVAVFCRDKLLMRNLIPANINLISD